MDLSSGKYLEHEICAVSGDWLVVYDGKYNYYLFNAPQSTVYARYKANRMPRNKLGLVDSKGVSHGEGKQTEYYSNFDNAVNNLVKVVANNGKWLTRARVVSS